VSKVRTLIFVTPYNPIVSGCNQVGAIRNVPGVTVPAIPDATTANGPTTRIPLSQRRVPPPKLSLTLDLSVTNPGVSLKKLEGAGSTGVPGGKKEQVSDSSHGIAASSGVVSVYKRLPIFECILYTLTESSRNTICNFGQVPLCLFEIYLFSIRIVRIYVEGQLNIGYLPN